jgi:hypothetical protein
MQPAYTRSKLGRFQDKTVFGSYQCRMSTAPRPVFVRLGDQRRNGAHFVPLFARLHIQKRVQNFRTCR